MVGRHCETSEPALSPLLCGRMRRSTLCPHCSSPQKPFFIHLAGTGGNARSTHLFFYSAREPPHRRLMQEARGDSIPTTELVKAASGEEFKQEVAISQSRPRGWGTRDRDANILR